MTALLVLGSNCGPRRENILKALESLRLHCRICRVSPIYESPDCLGSGKQYLNAVVEVDTELDIEALGHLIKKYERGAGRDEESRRRQDVPIDIDIVTCNGYVCRPADFHAAYFQEGLGKMHVNVKNCVN